MTAVVRAYMRNISQPLVCRHRVPRQGVSAPAGSWARAAPPQPLPPWRDESSACTSLRGGDLGRAIDAHDAVIRVNAAPTRGFEEVCVRELEDVCVWCMCGVCVYVSIERHQYRASP